MIQEWFLYFVAIVGASVVVNVLYESESILGTSNSVLNSQYETRTSSYESQQLIKKESRYKTLIEDNEKKSLAPK